MCAHATDMISQFYTSYSTRINASRPTEKIIFPHPTFNEAIGKL